MSAATDGNMDISRLQVRKRGTEQCFRAAVQGEQRNGGLISG
jgi:hypothetical protein